MVRLDRTSKNIEREHEHLFNNRQTVEECSFILEYCWGGERTSDEDNSLDRSKRTIRGIGILKLAGVAKESIDYNIQEHLQYFLVISPLHIHHF